MNYLTSDLRPELFKLLRLLSCPFVDPSLGLMGDIFFPFVLRFK